LKESPVKRKKQTKKIAVSDQNGKRLQPCRYMRRHKRTLNIRERKKKALNLVFGGGILRGKAILREKRAGENPV